MKFVRRQNLGALEIIAHLDTGGMAEVYLARNRRGGFSVVKLLNESMRQKPDIVRMFEEEGRILTSLDHPNIVKVQGQGELEGLPYISMEFLFGDHLGVLTSLAEKQGVVLGFPLIARIFLQVANGLAYVHEAVDQSGHPLGLVHRDVSPPNIMICYDGRVKLLDFGVAFVERKDRVTRTGLVKGKVHYMSPEQINARPVDRRSDIFSVGIVMWETVTGRDLADGDSDFQVMKQLCEEEIPPPGNFRLDLPGALEAIIMRCLERAPENRFQSAAELRQMLSDYLFAGENSGRPDDLPRMADRLLGERMRRKEVFLRSIQRESTLREDLFGDLDNEFKDPENTDVVPEPEVISAMLDGQADPAAQKARGLPLRLVLVILAGLVALAMVLWQAWPADPDASAGHSAPPGSPDPGPEAAGAPKGEEQQEKKQEQQEKKQEQQEKKQEQNQVTRPAEKPPATEEPPKLEQPEQSEEAEESVKPPGNLGYLILDTKPQTSVFLKNRYLGKTPIRDLPLEPGWYRLELINKEAGLKKKFTVRIRKNQVTSHRILY